MVLSSLDAAHGPAQHRPSLPGMLTCRNVGMVGPCLYRVRRSFPFREVSMPAAQHPYSSAASSTA